MAEGSKIGFQGNVPLDGESNIVQTVDGLASDILTLTGAVGQTGDFLVCQDSAGTEKFALTSSGVFVASTISGVGALTVGSTLTVTGVTSLNSAVAFSKSASFMSSVGFFGKTAVGTQSCATSAGTTSGSFGFDSSANFIIAVTLLNNIKAALVNLGLISTTA